MGLGSFRPRTKSAAVTGRGGSESQRDTRPQADGVDGAVGLSPPLVTVGTSAATSGAGVNAAGVGEVAAGRVGEELPRQRPQDLARTHEVPADGVEMIGVPGP